MSRIVNKHIHFNTKKATGWSHMTAAVATLTDIIKSDFSSFFAIIVAENFLHISLLDIKAKRSHCNLVVWMDSEIIVKYVSAVTV